MNGRKGRERSVCVLGGCNQDVQEKNLFSASKKKFKKDQQN